MCDATHLLWSVDTLSLYGRVRVLLYVVSSSRMAKTVPCDLWNRRFVEWFVSSFSSVGHYNIFS